MEYRELGRIGIKVSVIALGCEGFVANEGVLTEQLLNAAEQGGINCIDLYAPQPEMRSRLGKWLRGRRGKFVIIPIINLLFLFNNTFYYLTLIYISQYHKSYLLQLPTH